MITSIIVLIIALIVLARAIYIVPQQTTYIIERLGKFHTIAQAGIHLRIPLVDRIAAKIDMRIMQLENEIETKTEDDTFVALSVAVQYRVKKDSVYEAFYELSDPEAQIESYVEDSVRNSVPDITLDKVFSQKDKIAQAVKELLETKMDQYGFNIISTLITNIKPDPSVVKAMNSINEAQRRQTAAEALGEAEKITIVKKAEAQRDKMKLQGEGVAAQREAIITGLLEQVKELSVTGLSSEQIMSAIMANQYIDTLNGFAASPTTKTLFMNPSVSGMDSVQSSFLAALEAHQSDVKPDIEAIDELLTEKKERAEQATGFEDATKEDGSDE